MFKRIIITMLVLFAFFTEFMPVKAEKDINNEENKQVWVEVGAIIDTQFPMSFTNDITIILTPEDETKYQEVKLYAANDYISRFQLMEGSYAVEVEIEQAQEDGLVAFNVPSTWRVNYDDQTTLLEIGIGYADQHIDDLIIRDDMTDKKIENQINEWIEEQEIDSSNDNLSENNSDEQQNDNIQEKLEDGSDSNFLFKLVVKFTISFLFLIVIYLFIRIKYGL